jgi:GR25 family glycosyltransferase involved in LPS biosynthesis
MENQNTFIWEVTAWEFVFVTVILAGGAAYLTGRAIARTWQSETTLVGYMLLLAAATRFIHFALFSGTLLSPYYYLVDLVVITAIAFLGRRLTRAKQMATQYSFEYERHGSLSWARKG